MEPDQPALDTDLSWLDAIAWGPCPRWCTHNPDPAVPLDADGHMLDLSDDGTAMRFHECRWPLPDSDAPEAVLAVELEAVETCTKHGKPTLGEVRFLVNSDNGQYMSLAAASAASTIIRQALAEMATR